MATNNIRIKDKNGNVLYPQTVSNKVWYTNTNSQLSADNVQDAIDEVKTDVFGDNSYYWKDMFKFVGPKAASPLQYKIRKTALNTYPIGSLYNENAWAVFFFDVKAGEELKAVHLGCDSTCHAYAFYDATTEEMGIYSGISNSTTAYTNGNTYLSIIKGISEHYISGDTETTTNHAINFDSITVPTGAKTIGITIYYNSTNNNPGVTATIYRKEKKNPVSIADKTGRLIDGWLMNVVVKNTINYNEWTTPTNKKVYNVGDNIGYLMSNIYMINRQILYNGTASTTTNVPNITNNRLAIFECREGDKLLLDTYSTEYYSIFFTDASGVITSLTTERRLNGVYTVPNDGYVYINDVLHRENYIFDKAHGHLAYIALDARNKAPYSKDDWYNEYNPFFEPIEVDFSTSSTTPSPIYSAINSFYDGKFTLVAARMTVGENMEQTSGKIRVNSGTNIFVAYPQRTMATAKQMGTSWYYMIIQDLFARSRNSLYTFAFTELTANVRINYTIDKIFVHSFDDLAEAKKCAQGIWDGTYEPDQRLGIQTSEIDIAMNAVGAASTSALGYDIMSKGADFPIDNEGLTYGISLKGQAGRQFGSATDNGTADQNLVYLPVMDWSNFTGSKHDIFHFCRNLTTIPDIPWSSSLIIGNRFFRTCTNLRQVGNLTPAVCDGYSTFQECTNLEKVGNIDIGNTSSQPGYYMFASCPSLKEIGTLTNTQNIKDMAYMFNSCYSLKTIPPIDTQNVTSMVYCFYNCTSLENVTFTSNTNKVTTFQYCFGSCVYMEESPNITVSTVCTSIGYLFSGCQRLKTIHLSGDFSSVTTMQNSFYNCLALEEINVDLNTSSCTQWTYTFLSCGKLEKVKSIDFSSATTLNSTFSGCTHLYEIEIKNLGKSSLTSFDLRSLAGWGSETADALTSLKNTFINLYDRANNGMSNATIRVAAAVYTRIQSNLSNSEWASIAGKGYTLTNS